MGSLRANCLSVSNAHHGKLRCVHAPEAACSGACAPFLANNGEDYTSGNARGRPAYSSSSGLGSDWQRYGMWKQNKCGCADADTPGGNTCSSVSASPHNYWDDGQFPAAQGSGCRTGAEDRYVLVSARFHTKPGAEHSVLRNNGLNPGNVYGIMGDTYEVRCPSVVDYARGGSATNLGVCMVNGVNFGIVDAATGAFAGWGTGGNMAGKEFVIHPVTALGENCCTEKDPNNHVALCPKNKPEMCKTPVASRAFCAEQCAQNCYMVNSMLQAGNGFDMCVSCSMCASNTCAVY
jgi:hypothetical protein